MCCLSSNTLLPPMLQASLPPNLVKAYVGTPTFKLCHCAGRLKHIQQPDWSSFSHTVSSKSLPQTGHSSCFANLPCWIRYLGMSRTADHEPHSWHMPVRKRLTADSVTSWWWCRCTELAVNHCDYSTRSVNRIERLCSTCFLAPCDWTLLSCPFHFLEAVSQVTPL